MEKNLSPDSISNNYSIENIVMNGRYHLLGFIGFATGVASLTAMFNQSIILNKKMLIKSIRLVPFASGDTDELYDDTNTVHYIIKENARITKCVDEFTTSPCEIDIRINGGSLNIFPSNANGGPLLDTFVDNIYVLIPKLINSMEIFITGLIVDNFETQNNANPKMKVFIECYIF